MTWGFKIKFPKCWMFQSALPCYRGRCCCTSSRSVRSWRRDKHRGSRWGNSPCNNIQHISVFSVGREQINHLKFIPKKSFWNEFEAKLKRKKLFFDKKMEIAINFQLILRVQTLVWTEISNIAFNDCILWNHLKNSLCSSFPNSQCWHSPHLNRSWFGPLLCSGIYLP